MKYHIEKCSGDGSWCVALHFPYPDTRFFIAASKNAYDDPPDKVMITCGKGAFPQKDVELTEEEAKAFIEALDEFATQMVIYVYGPGDQ